MNDIYKLVPPTVANRKELVDLFLRRTQDEVEQMRRNVPALIRGDVAAWQEVRFCAQRICGTAKGPMKNSRVPSSRRISC